RAIFRRNSGRSCHWLTIAYECGRKRHPSTIRLFLAPLAGARPDAPDSTLIIANSAPAGRPRCHGVLLCFGLGGSPRTVHPQIKMAAWCRTLFTRVPAHVTFRSSWVDEAMEIRLVLPLERNIMAKKKRRKKH